MGSVGWLSWVGGVVCWGSSDPHGSHPLTSSKGKLGHILLLLMAEVKMEIDEANVWHLLVVISPPSANQIMEKIVLLSRTGSNHPLQRKSPGDMIAVHKNKK